MPEISASKTSRSSICEASRVRDAQVRVRWRSWVWACLIAPSESRRAPSEELSTWLMFVSGIYMESTPDKEMIQKAEQFRLNLGLSCKDRLQNSIEKIFLPRINFK
jgi:hypothetical protein